MEELIKPSVDIFELRKVVTSKGLIVYVDDKLNIYSRTMNLLTQRTDRRAGYLVVSVSDSKNRNPHVVYVHRIIAQAFIDPNLDDTKEVHHIDKNRTNNSIENLQVLSRYEHKLAHNLKYPITKICEVCGKEYTPHITKRERSHVCSVECQMELGRINGLKKRKPINQIDKETGEIIKTWDSGTTIENELGFFGSNINKCCHNVINSCYGYRWQFAE